ncbi:MAG: U32 family peptidase [Spirochaetes bacterium]|nr:U32 family peptidase [Spirochaetota bacterium]MBU0956519.1 U32 family peptidase [Spirochaetota bacterium]
MTFTTAELLAPAGTPDALDAAIGEGADAVYLGLKTFNARLRSANFAFSQFEAATDTLHKMGKKIYVTVNTVFEQREADRMYQLLQYLEKVGPDGIIVQDAGVIKMAAENFPGLALHASTQMNIGSAAGANFLSNFNFKRVVLSRELSLPEIKAVRAGTNLELETFVHGALCVSASGLCLFSSYLGGRSANRGACTQACRRMFKADDNDDGYYFSPDDLQLVEQVPDLVDAGVSSLKIEGRMKSSEYVGTVVAAYRYMLDNWRFDRERAAVKARAILQGDFARRKTTFWFDGTVKPDYIRPAQAGGTGIALGKVRVPRVFDDKRWMLLNTFDGLAEGDSIRIHSHDDSGRRTAKVQAVKQRNEGMYLQIDGDYNTGDEVYLIQTKSLSRRYKPVLPSALAKYHKFPSYDSAPKADFPVIPKERLSVLPEGMYAMVSRVQDLHTSLTERPDRAIIRFSRKNAELLRRHEKELPYKKDSLIFWLEPFFPEGDAEWLKEELEYWIDAGQKVFIANNLGHLSLLKGHKLTIISGPWLYAFNSWAAALYLGNGCDFLIPPLETGKQNFQRMIEVVPQKSLLLTVFAYPQLFTIRGSMGDRYKFRFFNDRDHDDYELVNDPDNATVIPVKPFSLTDRIPFFKRDNITKFIVDFSFVDIKKQIYRRVVQAARNGAVLPETGRFNWKDGFWMPEEEKVVRRTADDGERRTTGEAETRPERSPRTAGQRGGRTAEARSTGGKTGGRPERSPRGRAAERTEDRPSGRAEGRSGGRPAASRGSAERAPAGTWSRPGASAVGEDRKSRDGSKGSSRDSGAGRSSRSARPESRSTGSDSRTRAPDRSSRSSGSNRTGERAPSRGGRPEVKRGSTDAGTRRSDRPGKPAGPRGKTPGRR